MSSMTTAISVQIDKKDKEDPYEQLNQLMNKISSNKTKK